MIKSMTGFASLTREDERATIGVTLRAVNHRFLDVQLRQAAGVDVEFNEEFGRALETALEQARARGLVTGALTPGDLLRLPQAITIRDRQPTDDESWQADVAAQARETVGHALVDLDSMRSREGDHLRADLDARRAYVADLVERIAAAADDGRQAMEQRITDRVRELRTELQADENAVAQEIVRMAARSDISEEVERFRAHVSHWSALADSTEPCGRKLDFLLQEMNREINTIGSKAEGLQVSPLIVDVKAELERMREQVQNIE